MKKKNICLIIGMVLLIVMLIPIPLKLNDGGSIEYKAILYNVTKYHRLNTESTKGYDDGWKIKIVGITIYDNINTYVEAGNNSNEGQGTSDKYKGYKLVSSLSKIDYASTEILVSFDGILYGKSNSIIDYAGGSKKIGVIDKIIDKKYIPKLDNEANAEEIRDAEVYDKTEKSIILLYNNEYVLFEKISE